MEPTRYRDLSSEIINSPNIDESSCEIVKDIISKRSTIAEIIELLAAALTNKETIHRANGTLLLSKILQELPPDHLDLAQLNVIISFYVDRLKDNHSVIPAVVLGLEAISRMDSLADDAATRITTALFREVPCQQQLREDRFRIYVLIQNLLRHRPSDLIALGADFVYGVISAIDGERDPRNLMFIFSMLPAFLQTIPLVHLVEEMFDVISCYFPVDFNSSPNDPSAVTRDSLAEKLCPCLCAVPAFDVHCLPLALEKLDSNLRLAKLDSLKLLVETTKVFPPTSYEAYIPQIWSILQKEYANKIDAELRQYASDTLAALLNVLSRDANQIKLFRGFLQSILISMEAILVDATAKAIFDIPAAVYITCSRANKKSCIFIAENVFNSLLRFYNLNNDKALKMGALQCMSKIYRALERFDALKEINYNFEDLSQACLLACRDSDDNFKLAGFVTMALIFKVIPSCHLQELYSILSNSVDFENAPKLIFATKKCLLSLSLLYPEDVKILVKDKLTKGISKGIDEGLSQKRLDAFCYLVLNDNLSDEVMTFLTESMFESTNIAVLIIKGLREVFEEASMKGAKIAEIEDKYCLIEMLLSHFKIENVDGSDFDHSVAAFMHLIIRNLSAETQRELLSKHTCILLEAMESKRPSAVIPLHALYISVRVEVCPSDALRLIQCLLGLVMDGDGRKDIRLMACTLIASIVNKAYSREKNSDSFKMLYAVVDGALEENITSYWTVQLMVWFTKSLVLCGYPKADQLILKLSMLLEDEKHGMTAAHGFKTIMEESKDSLQADDHCTVSYLYRQRVFEVFVKYSETRLKGGSSDREEPFLLTWTYICQSIPKSLLKRVPQLQSIIVECLHCKGRDLFLPTLSIITFLVQNKDSQLADSLQTLLPRIVELTHYQDCMDIRIKSLEVLFNIAEHYSNVILLPYKQAVIHDWLIKQVDDRKRLVRNAAVKARTRWFLIGSPGEDKK